MNTSTQHTVADFLYLTFTLYNYNPMTILNLTLPVRKGIYGMMSLGLLLNSVVPSFLYAVDESTDLNFSQEVIESTNPTVPGDGPVEGDGTDTGSAGGQVGVECNEYYDYLDYNNDGVIDELDMQVIFQWRWGGF